MKRSGKMTTAAFPPQPVALTTEEQQEFESLADGLVAETLACSDDFILHGRTVDSQRWQLVKESGGVASYRQRSEKCTTTRRGRFWSEDSVTVATSPQMPQFLSSRNGSFQDLLETHLRTNSPRSAAQTLSDDSFDIDQEFEPSLLEKARPPNVPLVFATGIVPGTVEDAALGYLADTEMRGRMRNSNTDEIVIDDLRILNRIHVPTHADPFQFLGIKWSSHDSPTRGVLFKARDYVILESTGLALDAKGERFCYLLNHSIELEQVPDFRAFGQVRMTYSTCIVVRSCANAPGTMEIFSRGFMDAGGMLTERVCTQQFCDGLLAVPLIIEDSYMKKLAWLLESSRQNGIDETINGDSKWTDTCVCCHKEFRRAGLGKLFESSIQCHLCRRQMCRRCAVKKLLLEVASWGSLEKRHADFCVSCYLKAKEQSPWEVAVATLPKQKS